MNASVNFSKIADLQGGGHCHNIFMIKWLKVSFAIGCIMKKSLYIKQNQAKGNDCRELPLAYERDAGQAWYVVHCKPNSEQMALRNLKNQGFSTFLPLQKLTNRKGIGFQTRVRPLFPGYMFVAQKPGGGQWRKINSSRGVARLVCLAEDPTPVPFIIMNQLFELCDSNGVFQQSVNLVTGDNVKITQGPFSGMIGKINEIEPSQRVHLLLDCLGQKSKMTIDSKHITPIA